MAENKEPTYLSGLGAAAPLDMLNVSCASRAGGLKWAAEEGASFVTERALKGVVRTERPIESAAGTLGR